MIFDCHRHVEPNQLYDLGVSGSNYIFNDVAEYRQCAGAVREGNAISLIMDLKNQAGFVKKELDAGRIQALKIHSRRQQLTEADYPPFMQAVADWKIRVPIIVDAFYFGADLACQPSLPFIAALAKENPETPVVVAHSGGYELLKYFFHLRELGNVYFDLSFSLQYLADSSLYLDLKKVLRFWDRKRIMFGTDFPFASPTQQWTVLSDLMQSLSFAPEHQEAVAFTNACSLFTAKP